MLLLLRHLNAFPFGKGERVTCCDMHCPGVNTDDNVDDTNGKTIGIEIRIKMRGGGRDVILATFS